MRQRKVVGTLIRAGFLDLPFIPSGLHRGGVAQPSLERRRAEFPFSHPQRSVVMTVFAQENLEAFLK